MPEITLSDFLNETFDETTREEIDGVYRNVRVDLPATTKEITDMNEDHEEAVRIAMEDDAFWEENKGKRMRVVRSVVIEGDATRLARLPKCTECGHTEVPV